MMHAAPLAQIDRRILPGKCDENATSCRLFAGVRERRDEEGVAGQRALCALKQLAHQSPALRVRIERRVHDDAVLHVHHRAGFGDDHLAGSSVMMTA